MASEEKIGRDEPDCARPLRLLVVDEEDLAVVSTHLQDALVRVGDVAFLPGRRRFALIADRFDWCGADAGRIERRRSGLHFEGVTKASCQGVKQKAEDVVLNLLSISFVETDKPAGIVVLTFSGDAAIRLEVECLEAQMRDMGPRWPVAHKPGHDMWTTRAER
jgi:hypothetical protein